MEQTDDSLITATCIDGPLVGKQVVFKSGFDRTQVVYKGKYINYFVRLACLRHFPFFKRAWFLTASEQQPSDNKLDTVLEAADWGMDIQPSLLYTFDLWWEWVLGKLWLETPSLERDLDFKFSYHLFKRNHLFSSSMKRM